MDGPASTKASSGSGSGVRMFTLSCSRCRASKLKCDRKEPCMECVNRNVGHLCTKDERQRRGKRAKTGHNNKSNNNDDTKTKALESQETEVEETVQILEHFVRGNSHANAYSSAVFESALPFVAPDHHNTYWDSLNDPQRQDEKFILILAIIDAMPELGVIRLLYEVFLTRCQGPLGNVVHTPTFMKQAEKLCDCLDIGSPEAQAMAVFSALPIPILACHLLSLVLAVAFHPTPSIIGWSPTPLALRVEELRASNVRPKMWRSLAIRCLQGEVSLFCGSITSLQAAVMLLLDGQEGSLALDAVLVTAISGAQKLGLHRLGDAKLGVSVSPTYSEDISSALIEPSHVRTEIGIRIWWALVMRDWSRGQGLGYYSISPSQFNTRIPLHINDEDLCPTMMKASHHGHVTERPRSEFTMLSYTVHALEITILARESIDLRSPLSSAQRQEETNEGADMRVQLNKKYENFVAGLPSYFRLGNAVGLTSTDYMAAIPVQRWMLHQQLWSLFLRLHRTSLSSHNGRASCQLLAQNIISTQAHIQARCAVCGSLSTSETQVFSAAIVLLIDLLFPPEYKDADRSSAQLTRLITRDSIREAIELLRTRSEAEDSTSSQDLQLKRVKGSTRRSVIALDALMKLEEEESSNKGESDGAKSTANCLRGQRLNSDNNGGKLLKNKILDILEALEGNAEKPDTAMEQPSPDSFSGLDMSMPLLTASDGFQDLDVLPMLSNDPSHDFWQFLDFAPPSPPP